MSIVQKYYSVAMAEGWLTDRERYWVVRFHRDERSWQRDPRVFVDYGREMPVGEPAFQEQTSPDSRMPSRSGRRLLSGWVQTHLHG